MSCLYNDVSMIITESAEKMEKTVVKLTFSGTCPGDLATFKASFLREIEMRLRENSLCDNEADDVVEEYTCNRYHFEMSCGTSGSGRRRRRRDADQITIDMSIFIPR